MALSEMLQMSHNFIVMLSVIMQNVIMLSVIMLSVVTRVVHTADYIQASYANLCGASKAHEEAIQSSRFLALPTIIKLGFKWLFLHPPIPNITIFCSKCKIELLN